MAYVIKIKYENNLRRLTWGNELSTAELSFARLETRIRELLKLPATAVVAVTYTDKDSDVVTMANDHDLKDALVHQALNPLRLYVTLVNSNSTPSSLLAARAVDATVVKASEKSNLRAPGVNETKVESSSKVPASDVDDEQLDTELGHMLRKVIVAAESDMQGVRQILQSSEPLLQKAKCPAQLRGFMENFAQTLISRPQRITSTGSAFPKFAESGFRGLRSPGVESPDGDPLLDAVRSEKSEPGLRAVATASIAKMETTGEKEGAAGSAIEDVVHHGVICDVCEVSPIVGLRWKSIKKHDYDLCPSCFEKHGNVNEYTKIDQQMYRPRHFMHQRRSMPLYPPAMGSHHMGSDCHGSGSFGTRWSGIRGMNGRRFVPGPHRSTVGPYRGKLDARFVRDVTIFDGTELAPGTKFTKIWRLRNSGAGTWPSNTVLVHVGGEELGQKAIVPLELPPQGFAPEGEIEASVDFTAPEELGRYYSYWRLQASMHGPKFGHRVWVLIQVVPKETLDRSAVDSFVVAENGSLQELKSVTNSPSPSESDIVEMSAPVNALEAEAIAHEVPTQEGISVVNSNVSASEAGRSTDLDTPELEEVIMQFQSTMDFQNGKVAVSEKIPGDDSETGRIEVAEEEQVVNEVEPAVDESSTLGDGFSMVDRQSSAASGNELSAQPTEGEITVDEIEGAVKKSKVEDGEAYLFKFGEEEKDVALIGESVAKEEVPQTQAENSMVIPATTENQVDVTAEEDLSSLEGLLEKLKVMGFTDGKLNQELLEKNNLDLRDTLDELCAAEEWDSILEELEEMGFYDTDMNRRLMFKNNGSVKRVVKDLVLMDRETSGKGKRVVE